MKIKSNRGMTLIEIAIVFVVIGIAIALGASLVGPLTQRLKVNETRDTINADVESVIGYTSTNQKILDNITSFQSTVKNPKDVWSKSIYYFFDTSLTTAGSVCGRKTTNLTICRDAACTSTTNIQNVAFIVISAAENYNPQTGIITTGCPAGQTCIGVYDAGTANIDNCTTTTNCPDTNFPSTEDRINSSDSYDDIVKWVTLDELRIKIGCQGTQLKIVNNELPYGKASSAYPSVSVIADGGVPFSSSGNYKWCVKGTMPTGMSNPTPGCASTTSCSSLGTETEWLQSNSLTISGTPTAAGSYNITVLVRDDNDNNTSGNNDNCAQKAFVITVNP